MAKPSIVWTDEMLNDLGKMQDETYEVKWGIGKSSVARKRSALGISSFRTIKGEKLEELLSSSFGIKQDKEMALEFGLPETTIRYHRERLGGQSSKGTRIINEVESRKCGHCENWKSMDQFYDSKQINSKGKQFICKSCWIEYVDSRRKGKSGWNKSQEKIMNQVFERKCFWCDITEDDHIKNTGLRLSDEHFIPDNEVNYVIGNIYPACRSCNSEKVDRDALVWATKKFGLEYATSRYGELVIKLEESKTLYGNSKCSFGDCNGLIVANNLCDKHYKRMIRNGNLNSKYVRDTVKCIKCETTDSGKWRLGMCEKCYYLHRKAKKLQLDNSPDS